MNSAVEKAVREWKDEVDAEMVRLIEEGCPPYDAASKAREIVQRRRYQAKWKAKRDALLKEASK